VKFGERPGKKRLTSLSEALMLMGMDFKGHQHNALTDARNEAEVWRILHDQTDCDEKLGIAMEAMQDTPLAFTIADAVDLNSLKLTA
jgi:inhibitor of KinA sporulation pathway (predicted exonuclease)